MLSNDHYSFLFKLSCKVLKYFLLGLFGFALAWILSAAFGATQTLVLLLAALEHWILRLIALVLTLMMVAIVFESLRY